MYDASKPSPPERRSYRPDAADNQLGAWYCRCDIRGAETGPLLGKTFAIKDNTAVAGVPMMNGSRVLEGYVPSRDATVVTRILEAGGRILGKSACEDLCFSGASHTCATGPIRNPWDAARTSGGSSGGSGALVASGEVDMAIAGDQGGSIRMPSSFCGNVGLKPTFGLVPYTGAYPIEWTIDHLGPIARNMSDLATFLTVVAGPDGNDPRQSHAPSGIDYGAGIDDGIEGLKVGVVAEGFGWEGLSHPDSDALVEAAANRLADAGAQVETISIPEHRDAIHVWNVIATDGAMWQDLECLAELSHTLVGFLDPAALAQRTALDLFRLLGLPLVSVAVREGPASFAMHGVHGARTELFRQVRLSTGEGLGGRVLQERRPIEVRNYYEDPRITNHFVEVVSAEGLGGVLAVPVEHDNELVGLLYGGLRSMGSIGERARIVLGKAASDVAPMMAASIRASAAIQRHVDAERQRIAGELHDDVGQLLFSISVSAQRLRDGGDENLHAVGIVLKDASNLVDALRRVLAGEMYVDPSLVEDPRARALRLGAEGGLYESLTLREYEVLCVMALGRTSKEIAAELYLAENTVRSYTQSLLSKLHARNRIEALAVARGLRLL